MPPTPLAPQSDAAATERDAKRVAILGALQGQIDPVPVSLGYMASALLVAIVMLLLPLVYISLIGAVAYATYLHAVYDTEILQTKVRGKGYLLVLMVYGGPILIGAIVCLFLVKPLFARPVRIDRGQSVTRLGEPFLFEFIDRLCKAVGAPLPRRIDIDLDVNASASFRRGMLSMFGTDLVLTIGLPLVAGLTCRQFAGVLAHEFGHFTQGAGMRLTYVIRTISGWFARVAYERDTWDEWLDATCRDGGHWGIMMLAMFAKGGVWVGRLVLKGLFFTGTAVGGVMLRQMEYNADLHAIRLAGSQNVIDMSRRVRTLHAALGASFNDLNDFYRDGRLGDNLPALVVANDKAMPVGIRQAIIGEAEKTKTGYFDTHPCDRDRNAAAERAKAPGIFTYEGPATDLFSDFAKLAKSCTLDLYRDSFGPQVRAEDLQSVELLLAGQREDQALRESVSRFFVDGYRLRHGVSLPWIGTQAPADPKAAVQSLRDLREQLRVRRGTVPSDSFEPDDEFRGIVVQRLTLCLQLLNHPAVQKRVPDGAKVCADVSRIYSAAQLLHRESSQVRELGDGLNGLGAALEQFSKNQNDDYHRRQVVKQMEGLWNRLHEVHQSFATEAYPLEHAEAGLTLAKFILKEMPPPEDLGALHGAVSRTLENYAFLNLRLTGRLTAAAEKVEAALKLPPLTVSQPAPAPS